MENINWFSMISFIASLASLILAVVAIKVTLYIKGETDKVSQKTSDLLTDIKSDAKAISQVAMPELKAYGDSMRRFMLGGGGQLKEKNAYDSSSEVISKLDEIDTRLKGLEGENDIAKLKMELKKVSKDIEDSEIRVVKRMVRKRDSKRVGVRIELKGDTSIETSTPNESWQDLLGGAMSMEDADVTRENYGEVWTLVNEKTASAIPKNFITDTGITFDDAGLVIGDDLSLIILK